MKAEEIKVINVDGVVYAVEGTSNTVQRLVGVLNEWRQREVNAREELMLVQAAIRQLSQEIAQTIRNEKNAVNEKAEAPQTTEGTVSNA